MKIKKIKYCIAVAALAATAFCGCGDDDGIIALETGAPAAQAEEPVPEREAVPEDAGNAAVKVYVCGAVKNPDVYTLGADLRMIDAVNAAGGFREDAGEEYLNLAAKITDGQKIYIPTVTEIEEAFAENGDTYASIVNITSNSPGIKSVDSAVSGNGQQSTDGMVNINTASRETLMTIPGIGQSKADLIIAYREENGGFSSIEDIMLVRGIKEGLFNKVKDRICVGN